MFIRYMIDIKSGSIDCIRTVNEFNQSAGVRRFGAGAVTVTLAVAVAWAGADRPYAYARAGTQSHVTARRCRSKPIEPSSSRR